MRADENTDVYFQNKYPFSSVYHFGALPANPRMHGRAESEANDQAVVKFLPFNLLHFFIFSDFMIADQKNIGKHNLLFKFLFHSCPSNYTILLLSVKARFALRP
jgi:hypothetical protein